MRRCLFTLLVLAALIGPAQASAAITSVFAGDTMNGLGIPCPPQSDGVRVCHGTDGGSAASDLRLKDSSGSPLEVYVILPSAPTTGGDGGYPLVVQSHGWGQSAGGPDSTQYLGPTARAWAQAGYAVLQLTARGWGDSCSNGNPQSRLVNPAACANGYIRLDDDRYEVRDIQDAVGELVDQGVADPTRLGATGESYGGGASLQLATLKDRVMNPDGTVSPWTSPAGTRLSLAAAAPVIPWSDLVHSLVPNGRTLDYQVTSTRADLSPIGVEKQSFVSGLYASGESGSYAPPGTDEQADLTTWYGSVNAGEPYDSNPNDTGLVDQIAHYHSAYYLLDNKYGIGQEAPAPLLIANGFTDDLFPVDEAVRYYNLDRSLYPSNPIELIDGDFGHMRAQNKPTDLALLSSGIQTFFDHYVKGTSAQPGLGASATIETCPKSAPSGPTYTASTWDGLHPGEVDYSSAAAQTVSSGAGDPSISRAVDPVAGGGACATVSGNDQGSGVATYRLPKVSGPGYTLLGSPTVIANLGVSGQFPYIAARLWDVDTSANTQTLVARGLYRIDANAPDGLQVFQLHPGAWHFAAGHQAKLELLGQDAPYARPSNGQFSITVSSLQLRLPVHERPGTVPGVGAPLPHVTPHPHRTSGSGCTNGPVSKLNKRRVRGTRRLLLASGTARERSCLGAGAAAGRVARVYVMIYKPARHGRCRFVTRSGKLTLPRSCRRPIEFRARGTGRWHIRLRIRLRPGVYLVRSDAVDSRRHHQPRTTASVVRIRVGAAPGRAADFTG